jgi:hypothetical protein
VSNVTANAKPDHEVLAPMRTCDFPRLSLVLADSDDASIFAVHDDELAAGQRIESLRGKVLHKRSGALQREASIPKSNHILQLNNVLVG